MPTLILTASLDGGSWNVLLHGYPSAEHCWFVTINTLETFWDFYSLPARLFGIVVHVDMVKQVVRRCHWTATPVHL